jgi:hypothetical protein
MEKLTWWEKLTIETVKPSIGSSTPRFHGWSQGAAKAAFFLSEARIHRRTSSAIDSVPGSARDRLFRCRRIPSSGASAISLFVNWTV